MIRFSLLFQMVLVVGIICGAHPAMADSECLDQTTVDEIRRDFKFEGDVKVNICDAKNIGFQVLKAIQFIKEVKGAGTTLGIFALDVLKDEPYEFFKKRVHTIAFEDHSEPCDGHAAAYMQFVGDRESDHRMHVCTAVYAEQPSLSQASILVHEARHVDGFRHVKCIRGANQYRASGSCDSSYKEAGSYGVEVSFLIRILQDATVSPALRNSARALAAQGLIYRFNSLPAELKDGALLTDKNRTVSFYDGKSTEQVLQMEKDQSLLYLTNGAFPVIANHVSNQYIYFTHALANSTKSEQAEKVLLDFATSEKYTYMLYEEGIILSSENDDQAVFRFSQIRPLSIFNRVKNDGSVEVILTDRSGRWVVLPKNFKKFQDLRESDLKMETNKGGVLKIQTMQDRKKDIVLTTDGRLFFMNRQNGSYTQILQENSYINVTAPVVWSKSLQDL